MHSIKDIDEPFVFSEANIQRLKEKYSTEMKDVEDNPMKICMKLIFSSANEKDPDKRSDLALELSRFLTKQDGILNLFLALLDFDTSSQITTTHNQRFIAVSNIITCLPGLCIPYEQYCANIFQQLKPMLVSDQPKYSTLACMVLKSMLESPHAKNKHVNNIIFEPIFKALQGPESTVFKSHEAIIAIHNMLKNYLPTKLFVEIFPHLFYCLVSLQETPSRLKSLLKTSLVDILDGLEPGVACCLLEETVFYNEKVSLLYSIEAEDSGEISIKITCDKTAHELCDKANIMKNVIISLLESCGKQTMILEFYFHFQELMWTAKDHDSKHLSASLIEPLLLETVQEKTTKLDLLDIIATNGEKTIELISRILLNYVAFLRSSVTIEPDQKLFGQSISSCLSILEVLCTTDCDGSIARLSESKCLPILEELHGLLSNRMPQDELDANVVSLINRMRATMRTSNFTCQDSAHNKVVGDYNNIMKDLNDKIVPVRVHALVRLKQLILSNDKFVVSKIPKLYPIIEIFLSDPEPYVYLACINLMVEMSVRKTDDMLPKLMNTYINEGLNLQHRVNAGEILVRVTKQMNETTPLYARQVMDTLLVGCRHVDELIRISSLTNIGEICRNLTHSLDKYMIEILGIVDTIINTDTLCVKCAAIDLLRTTLMGLDRFSVESIQRELKSIYNLLKRLRCRTLDDKLCLQLDLALDEMDRLAHKLMLGDDSLRNDGDLVKEIKVMSLFDHK